MINTFIHASWVTAPLLLDLAVGYALGRIVTDFPLSWKTKKAHTLSSRITLHPSPRSLISTSLRLVSLCRLAYPLSLAVFSQENIAAVRWFMTGEPIMDSFPTFTARVGLCSSFDSLFTVLGFLFPSYPSRQRRRLFHSHRAFPLACMCCQPLFSLPRRIGLQSCWTPIHSDAAPYSLLSPSPRLLIVLISISSEISVYRQGLVMD